MFRRGVFTFLGVLLIAGPAWAVDPADKCEAAKLKEAGKYHYCRMKAESKAVKKSEPAIYTKCVSKINQKWPLIEQKGEGACPTNGDQAAIETETTDHVNYMALILHDPNYSPPGCGDGIADPNANEQCDGDDLGGADCTTLGFAAGTLACDGSCFYDLTGCIATTCGNGTVDPNEQCDFGDLGGGTCQTQGFAYGTLACGAGCTFDTSGCTNTRFVDPNDGTIIDNETGLMWEKKVAGSDCLHCVNDEYPWSPGFE
jgi:hypothetical protein